MINRINHHRSDDALERALGVGCLPEGRAHAQTWWTVMMTDCKSLCKVSNRIAKKILDEDEVVVVDQTRRSLQYYRSR